MPPPFPTRPCSDLVLKDEKASQTAGPNMISSPPTSQTQVTMSVQCHPLPLPLTPWRRKMKRAIEPISASPCLQCACRTQARSEEHTSELQSLMHNSYTVFCLKKKNKPKKH